MNAALITARITAALHRASEHIADFCHELHAAGLTAAYNAVGKAAADLRQELSALGAETRDATMQAKIEFQRAVKAAQDAFDAEVKRVVDTHTVRRAAIVAKLDATNTKARETADAIEQHDAV
jgi:hypothetical protein